MEYHQALDKLAKALSAKRFQHSLGVSQTAGELAQKFGVDVEKARLAGLLHDCARNFSNDDLLQKAEAFAIVMKDVESYQPILLHAPVGAYIANIEYGVDDQEILDAIRLHTTGGPNMSPLEKILYVADCIEPSRNFPGIDRLRSLAAADLNAALLAAFDQSLHYVIEQGLLIHPATVEGRNYLLQNEI